MSLHDSKASLRTFPTRLIGATITWFYVQHSVLFGLTQPNQLRAHQAESHEIVLEWLTFTAGN
jgi:hypothetical protein